MLQVYIWGAGYCAGQVIGEIDSAKAHIAGILDNDEHKHGLGLFDSVPVIPPSMIKGKEFDYLIISAKDYAPIEQECKRLGIPSEKIISYWKNQPDAAAFIGRAARIEMLIKEKRMLENRLESAPYEWGLKKSPKILSAAELLKKIFNDGSSLCRFGDGEFDIMRGRKCSWFQNASQSLRERLFEVINSRDDSINIAIAQDFTDLERYKEAAADEIRAYMSNGTREAVLQFLDLSRAYYDAYVTRPYILYKDRNNADRTFPMFKSLWKNRAVVLVEGEYARNGVNNDLFSGAMEIRRVICPSKDAWAKYDEIKDAVLNVAGSGDLICISLGPAATILAYDLAKRGCQALDIGQVDNEYDWYTAGAVERTAIEGKMVAEIADRRVDENFRNDEYASQIMAVIRLDGRS